MQEKYKIVHQLSREQLQQLMELYSGEEWTYNRKLEDVEKILQRSWTTAVIHEESGDLVAFARVLSDSVYRAFIYDVIVAEKYRGRGYGRIIIESIVEHEDLRHIERIDLFCRSENVQFYEKQGFRVVDKETNLMSYDFKRDNAKEDGH